MAKHGKDKKGLKEHAAIDHVPDPSNDGDSKFARALGSGDFHTRDKGVKALTLWLQRQTNIGDEGLKKIWRGIFFCFWHSDKAHVQEDLAKRLAAIFPQLKAEVALGYFKAFAETMHQQWPKIDRLRLDKFMMMVRKFLEQLFTCMADRDWDEEYVRQYMALLQSTAFQGDDALTTVGFGLHVADVFLPELLRASSAAQRAVPAARAMDMLSTFSAVLSATRQPALVARIRSSVFEALADELCNPSEGAALQAIEAAELAEALLEAGGAESVRHKNRSALYELSQRFEHVDRKRKRSAAKEAATAAGDALPTAKRRKLARPLTPAADVEMQTEAGAVNGNGTLTGGDGEPPVKAKKAARLSASKFGAGSTPGQPSTSANGTHTPLPSAGNDDTLISTSPKQTKSAKKAAARRVSAASAEGGPNGAAANGTANREAPASDADTPMAEGSAKKKKAKQKAGQIAAGGAGGEQPALGAPSAKRRSESSDSLAATPLAAAKAHGSAKKSTGVTEAQEAATMTPSVAARVSKKLKKALLAAAPPQSEPAAQHVEGRTRAGRHSMPAGGADAVGEAAQAALSNAVRAVASAKKLHFDLKKNVTHQIGKPLPAAHLRTPPRAKPNGSALKKVSNLPTPLPDSAVARKLNFSGSKKRPRATDF